MNKYENLRIWVFLEETKISSMDIGNYPLVVGKAIYPWLQKKHHLISKVENNNGAFFVQFKAITIPHFRFSINKFLVIERGEPVFEIVCRPKSVYEETFANIHCKGSDIEAHFNEWLALIIEYKILQEKIDTIGDPILKQSQEEILDWFQVDDNDDVQAFDTQTQFKIEAFTHKVVEFIELNPDLVDDVDKEKILNQARELIKRLPQSTRKQVKQDISKLGALVKKGSIMAFKEFVKELVKEGVKFMMKEENIRALLN